MKAMNDNVSNSENDISLSTLSNDSNDVNSLKNRTTINSRDYEIYEDFERNISKSIRKLGSYKGNIKERESDMVTINKSEVLDKRQLQDDQNEKMNTEERCNLKHESYDLEIRFEEHSSSEYEDAQEYHDGEQRSVTEDQLHMSSINSRNNSREDNRNSTHCYLEKKTTDGEFRFQNQKLSSPEIQLNKEEEHFKEVEEFDKVSSIVSSIVREDVFDSPGSRFEVIGEGTINSFDPYEADEESEEELQEISNSTEVRHDTDTIERIKHEFLVPLAQFIRPKGLEDYIGQKHLINDNNGSIKNFIRLGYLPSMILYGPPGVGKTTLASILAKETGYVFIELSATDSKLSDIRDLQNSIKEENVRRENADIGRLRVAIFIDEVHRFNKTQQDFLLPFIEAGHFVFIGATTVNPKTRIQRAILSRCQIYKLELLESSEINDVIRRAILFENMRRRVLHKLKFLYFDDKCRELVEKQSLGDTRQAINLIELISNYYSNDKLAYLFGDHEPYKLNFEELKKVIKIVKGNQTGLHDSRNLNLFLNLFDSMRHVYGSRDIECMKDYDSEETKYYRSPKDNTNIESFSNKLTNIEDTDIGSYKSNKNVINQSLEVTDAATVDRSHEDVLEKEFFEEDQKDDRSSKYGQEAKGRADQYRSFEIRNEKDTRERFTAEKEQTKTEEFKAHLIGNQFQIENLDNVQKKQSNIEQCNYLGNVNNFEASSSDTKYGYSEVIEASSKKRISNKFNEIKNDDAEILNGKIQYNCKKHLHNASDSTEDSKSNKITSNIICQQVDGNVHCVSSELDVIKYKIVDKKGNESNNANSPEMLLSKSPEKVIDKADRQLSNSKSVTLLKGLTYKSGKCTSKVTIKNQTAISLLVQIKYDKSKFTCSTKNIKSAPSQEYIMHNYSIASNFISSDNDDTNQRSNTAADEESLVQLLFGNDNWDDGYSIIDYLIASNSEDHDSPSYASDCGSFDSEDELFKEYLKSRIISKKELDHEYFHQMQVSDDSDFEQGSIYSDDEDEIIPYDLEKMSKDKFFILLSIYYLVLLLKRGESPFFIGKQLVLFTSLYLDSHCSELSKTLASLRSLKNANPSTLMVLSNLVERLTRSKKRKIILFNDPVKQLKILTQFWNERTHEQSKRKGTSLDSKTFDSRIEVSYDSDILKEVFAEMDTDLKESEPNPTFVVSNLSDLGSDEEFNLGEDFGSPSVDTGNSQLLPSDENHSFLSTGEISGYEGHGAYDTQKSTKGEEPVNEEPQFSRDYENIHESFHEKDAVLDRTEQLLDSPVNLVDQYEGKKYESEKQDPQSEPEYSLTIDDNISILLPSDIETTDDITDK